MFRYPFDRVFSSFQQNALQKKIARGIAAYAQFGKNDKFATVGISSVYAFANTLCVESAIRDFYFGTDCRNFNKSVFHFTLQTIDF